MDYDPFVKKPMVEAYPELDYPEFTIPSDPSSNLDGFLRFVILFTSEDSPYYKETDLDRRKNKCTSALNLEFDTLKQIDDESHDYKMVMLRWFKINFSYLFEEWMSRKLAFHQDTLYLRTSPFDKKHGADAEKVMARQAMVKKNLPGDRDELLGLESRLFKNKLTQKLVNSAVNSMEGYAEEWADKYDEI